MKQKISVIVPVMNELENIKVLNKRLQKVFTSAGLPYEVIYIDDNSTDGTYEYLKKLSLLNTRNTAGIKKQLRVRTKEVQNVYVFKKDGIRGKAYSLIEGFSKATGSVFVMIDADLQYPPEAIPYMIAELENSDIIVANRKEYHSTGLRRLASRTFKKFFGDVLFGLNTDVQSGLKVFKRKVFDVNKTIPKSPWTFDLEFLYKAREAGYTIANYDISFSRRENGRSNVRFLQQSYEIGTNALQVRLARHLPLIIPPTTNESMVGAGIGFKKQQYITHTTLPHHQTALKTFTRSQIFVICSIVFAVLLSLIEFPLITVRTIVGILSVVYFIDVVFNLFIVMRSLHTQQEISAEPYELEELDEQELPMYSILCPLYKEVAILPQFLDAIAKLDWPKDKIDVLLLLEEDDVQTIEATKHMNLPAYVRPVIVPHSFPKTKPKACNYGLNFVKGDLVVIFDAEDVPDPLQLKKAYLGFKNSPEEIVCLQAKLNYYNPHQNMLTRFFTAEYSLWFDVTLTGFQSINTSLPLGGTSNHFKTKQLKALHGWDTFNVTEDADLGIRLFKNGYKTAIIDSVTLEEANSNVRNWIRQRSRWLKGYMQSYLVHMRDFFLFARTKGIHAILFQLVIGSKLVFIFLNPVLWILTISYFVLRAQIGPVIELMYISPVFYLAAISLVFGNFLFLYYYLTGTAKRKQWDLMKYVLFIPVYWILISIAGWMAFYQLLFKPHYWEKTIHGLHLKKKKDDDSDTDQNTPEQTVEVKPSRLFIPRPAFVTAMVQGTRLSVVKYTLIITNNIVALSSLFRGRHVVNEKQKNPAILIFNWRDTKHVWAGGAEVYVHEIAKRWAQDGNDVMIFCGKDRDSALNQTIDGVQITRRGGLYTVYFWAFLYYLFVFRGKYDVVVDCENGIPFFTPLYIRKPIFLLIHHVHQEVFREHLAVPFSTLARFMESTCMPLLYRNRPVITVSESSKREIIKLGFSNSENISIVHNGIKEDLFIPSSKTAYPSFIYLGRLKPYKNIDTALTAFKKVLNKYPNAQFDVVGAGESKPELHDLVKTLGIKEQVKFHGKVSEKSKAVLLARSWAMLQPSMVEGWGITVLEANASGTPVIAARVNGLQDSVVDGKTGILIDPKNIDDFANAMLYLIENPSFLNQMAQQALLWSQNFSWDKSAYMLYSLLKTALPRASFLPSYGSLMVADTK